MNRIKILVWACVLVSTAGALSLPSACTIGVASGDATADGRPLLWKTRDWNDLPRCQVFDSTFAHSFIAIADDPDFTADTTSIWPKCAWMGVNETGFAIANSTSDDLKGRLTLGNGNLVRLALGHCHSVADFADTVADLQTAMHLDSVHGNFAVIDSAGGAAIFEIAAGSFHTFHADSAGGYLVRTNFSETGGGSDGRTRYDRSMAILGRLTSEGRLDYESIIREQFRDLSPVPDEDLTLPFAGHWQDGLPYGYVPCESTICRSSSISAVAIRGIVEGEHGWHATMWTLLGPPVGAIAVPYFPVGPAPPEARGPGPNLYELARARRDAFVYPRSGKRRDDPSAFDTFALAADVTGLWPQLAEPENAIFAAYRELLPAGADEVSSATREDLRALQAQLAADAFAGLLAIVPDTVVTADFVAESHAGCAPYSVYFEDRSLHGPEEWIWRFGDGDSLATTSCTSSRTHMYETGGEYTVSLSTRRGASEAELVREAYVSIHEMPAAARDCKASDDSCGVLVRWTDASDCEEGFYVYRNDVLIDSVAADVTRYHDTPPTTAPFGYSVVAFNRECASDPSNEDVGHAAAFRAPEAPAIEQPEGGTDCVATSVVLRWRADAVADSAHLLLWESESGALVVDSLLAGEDLVVELEPGVAYTWSVSGENACGCSDPAVSGFRTTPHPLALPEELVVARPSWASDSLSFSWQAVPGAATYELSVGASCAELPHDGSLVRTTSACGVTLPAVLIGAEAGFWGVRAGACGQLAAGVSCDSLSPLAVTDFGAMTSSAGVLLSWSCSRDDRLDSFQIVRDPGSSAPDTLTGADLVSGLGTYAYCDSSADLAAEHEYLLLGCTPLERPIPLARTEPTLPRRFAVRHVRPNPFRAEAVFELAIPPDVSPVLEIYDLTGRRVRDLSRQLGPAGIVQVTWDGCGDQGHRLPSGVYFARVGAGHAREIRRLTLVR
ncbi:MAG: hypothetical protein GF330_13815 [Candidatus Eisenbacteria bacterium]|nr:hypothetical protein [Candidatus Eisenbacteria bacterium]